MRMPDRFRRFVEHLLPWYDSEVEARRAEQSAEMHAHSIAVRQEAEQRLAHASASSIRDAYARYAHRVNGHG